jgi:cytoskeletal protein CcmA (bactofilin family)
MFRRPGKNPLDAHSPLFQEEVAATAPYKYNLKKPEEAASRLFESLPHKEERTDSWGQEKLAPYASPLSSMEEEPETTLGEGVTFRGELCFERLLRIDGTFEGTLISQGKIIVGPKGKVKADLNLKEAIIEGEVEGNICVQEKLQLRASAAIRGNIKAASLCVDEGVRIVGHVTVPPPLQDLGG